MRLGDLIARLERLADAGSVKIVNRRMGQPWPWETEGRAWIESAFRPMSSAVVSSANPGCENLPRRPQGTEDSASSASLRLDEGLARTLEHFRGGRVPRSASAAHIGAVGRWVDSSVARRYSYRMRSSDEQTPSDAESDEREMWLLREIAGSWGWRSAPRPLSSRRSMTG